MAEKETNRISLIHTTQSYISVSLAAWNLLIHFSLGKCTANTHMLIIFVNKLYQTAQNSILLCADSQTIFQFFHPLILGLQRSHLFFVVHFFFFYFFRVHSQWNTFLNDEQFFFLFLFFPSFRVHYKSPIKHTRKQKTRALEDWLKFFFRSSSAYNLLNSHSHTYTALAKTYTRKKNRIFA